MLVCLPVPNDVGVVSDAESLIWKRYRHVLGMVALGVAVSVTLAFTNRLPVGRRVMLTLVGLAGAAVQVTRTESVSITLVLVSVVNIRTWYSRTCAVVLLPVL